MIGTRPTIHVTFGSWFPFIPREFQVDCNPIWNTDTQLRIQARAVSCARSSKVGMGLALYIPRNATAPLGGLENEETI